MPTAGTLAISTTPLTTSITVIGSAMAVDLYESPDDERGGHQQNANWDTDREPSKEHHEQSPLSVCRIPLGAVSTKYPILDS